MRLLTGEWLVLVRDVDAVPIIDHQLLVELSLELIG